MIEIHKSGVQDFVKCPFRFFLNWIAKEQGSYDSTIVLDKGTIMHEAFESFFDFFSPPVLNSMMKLSRASLKKMFRDILAEYYREYPILRIAFDNFIDFEASRFVELRNAGRTDLWIPALREFQFEAPLSDNIIIKGTIDRVDRLMNGGYAIVEYKSSQVIDMTSLRRELYFYMITARKSLSEHLSGNATNIGVIAPLAVKLRNARKFTRYAASRRVGFFILEPISNRSIKAVDRWVKILMTAIRSGDFPRNENACMACPFRDSCTQLYQKYAGGKTHAV